jgi:hypothetical protein
MRIIYILLILLAGCSPILAQEELAPETILWQKQVGSTVYDARTMRDANEFINLSKFHGNFSNIYRFWYFNCFNQAYTYISLVNPASTAISIVNSPAWTLAQGYKGDGANSYIDSKYAPSSSPSQGSIGYYGYDQNSAVAAIQLGIQGTASVSEYFAVNFTGGEYVLALSASAITNTGTGATTQTGLNSLYRTDGTHVHVTHNGVDALGALSSTAGAALTRNIYILCIQNSASTPADFYSGTIGMAYTGAASINQATFYSDYQVLLR